MNLSLRSLIPDFEKFSHNASRHNISDPSWGTLVALIFLRLLIASLTWYTYCPNLQHRLNWSIDYKTGEYSSLYPTPTGNPADPTLTSHGVRQSHELAAHVASPQFTPKPFRVYSSPFYRCLQTIRPSVETLKERQRLGVADIDNEAVFDVRIENGLG